MLIVLERKCLDLSEVIEQLSEKQELLATFDGEQELSAKRRSRKISGVDLPGV